MSAWAVIQNIVILLVTVYLVASGHSLWWLLLFLGMNAPRSPQE